ncbi:MAG TPA: hypothetical protein VGC55_05585 [Dokdonella sp.]
MKRRARTNLILLAVSALLGLAVWAELRREQTMGDPLTSLDIDAVHTIVVACAGCTPRHFEKQGAHWRMLEPYAQPADDRAIARLLAIARAPVRLRHAAGELDAKKIGLDPPQATLQLDGTLLKFGKNDAIDGDRYADVGGSVALVPDRFSVLLFAAPENELAKAPPAAKD